MEGLLGEGLKLMLLGMGTVFMFLIAMIVVMKVVAVVVKPFQHLLEEAPTASAPVKSAGNTQADDGSLVAVISAAIAKFRSDKKG